MSSTTADLNAPITKQKLSDQVFDRLRNLIMSGELAPGDAMPSERILMERFGVGRPAVREALQALSNKGLITITHGERSRVKQLNANVAFEQLDDIAKMMLSTESDNLEHLKELRKILEVGTVRVAAQHCTATDVEDLRELLVIQRGQLDDPKAFIESDMAFHVRIAKITGNPLLQAVIQAMLTWIHEYYRPLLHWSGREENTLKEHEEIINYLEKHDEQGAETMICDHLNRVNPLYSSQEE